MVGTILVAILFLLVVSALCSGDGGSTNAPQKETHPLKEGLPERAMEVHTRSALPAVRRAIAATVRNADILTSIREGLGRITE